MAIVSVIFGQTMIMFLIMLIGFLCFRVGLIDDTGSQQISNVVIYISNPALLLNSFIGELFWLFVNWYWWRVLKRI